MERLTYLVSLLQEYPDAVNDLGALDEVLRLKTVKALDTLLENAARCEREHGFGADTRPAEDFALMHSELSEALEELRDGHTPSELYYSMSPGKKYKPEGVPAELADVLIRIFGFARRHSIDLAEAVVRKMLYNETRPYKNGGKSL